MQNTSFKETLNYKFHNIESITSKNSLTSENIMVVTWGCHNTQTSNSSKLNFILIIFLYIYISEICIVIVSQYYYLLSILCNAI